MRALCVRCACCLRASPQTCVCVCECVCLDHCCMSFMVTIAACCSWLFKTCVHADSLSLAHSLLLSAPLSSVSFPRARYFQRDWVQRAKNLLDQKSAKDQTTSSATPLIFSFPEGPPTTTLSAPPLIFSLPAQPQPAIAAAAPGSILLPSTVGRVEQRPAGEWVTENVR